MRGFQNFHFHLNRLLNVNVTHCLYTDIKYKLYIGGRCVNIYCTILRIFKVHEGDNYDIVFQENLNYIHYMDTVEVSWHFIQTFSNNFYKWKSLVRIWICDFWILIKRTNFQSTIWYWSNVIRTSFCADLWKLMNREYIIIDLSPIDSRLNGMVVDWWIFTEKVLASIFWDSHFHRIHRKW